MKIIYLIAGMYRAAGMECTLAMQANWFAGKGDDVLIVTTEQKGRRTSYNLNPSVRLVDLDIGYEETNGRSFPVKLITHPVKLLRHRKLLTELLVREKADIVVSLFCNEADFVPDIQDGSRKILQIHFSRFKRLQYARSGLWALADKIRFRREYVTASRYDRFVVLTQEDAANWKGLDNISVIPNARTFTCDSPADTGCHQVLAAGRYSHQKGFDMLIRAWKMTDTAGWTLRIAGSGPIEMLGDDIPDNVVTGPSQDMRSEYLHSSIFALSSRYEGLPMVLLEAQAAGLPSVCFKCKCGPRDIISDGKDGLLVEEGDVEAFSKALALLMKDSGMRSRMGTESYRNSSRFEEKNIMGRWEKLFAEL